MSNTVTRTVTYTRVDVGKTFESFRSNLRMICMSSGCDGDSVEQRADDVLTLAYAGYLKRVDVVLFSATGQRLRAGKFAVSEDAGGWSSDMPGDNIWPATAGGSISLIIHYSKSWSALSEARQAEFRQGLTIKWVPSNQDTTFAEMEADGARRYASNAYGLEQTTFRKRVDQ
jgi:hypothetical protein